MLIDTLPHTGRLLSAIVVLVVSLSALSLGFSILRSGLKTREAHTFAYFWITTGLLWFSSAMRNVFAAYNAINLDIFFFYLTQIFLFISGIFLASYLVSKLVRNRKATIGTEFVYVCIAFVGIFASLRYGVTELPPDFFTTKYVLNYPANLVALGAMIPVIILSLIEFLILLKAYVTEQESVHDLLAVASIAAYLMIGLIDETGILTGWPLILFRVVYLCVFLLAYSAVLREKETDVIPKDTFEI